jgi:hypothetical protein
MKNYRYLFCQSVASNIAAIVKIAESDLFLCILFKFIFKSAKLVYAFTSPLFTVRRTSHEARSPSPTKSGGGGFSVQSPVSPGGSSGFSSRRSSQDGFHLEGSSPSSLS